jgi:hypothetical protein
VASTHQKENYTTLIYQDFIGIDLNRNQTKFSGLPKVPQLPQQDWDYISKSQVEAMGGTISI